MKKIIHSKDGAEYEIEDDKVIRVYVPKTNTYLAPYKYNRKLNCSERVYVSYSYLKKCEKDEYSPISYNVI